ncbi:zinc finger HIT domain-containing protein 1 [Condylostylus longicornis]|uniref:zinc finger HIT domain-containing protein 1 n=1 Tax=Condylostylus longicornis TaxID=2530218 RepID=UPI00244E1D91|nr:zinc finger HIT domain-containing protein 1 [Condylostylus longicornis]
MSARESHRIKEAEKKRVLDEFARQRRARKALEALEQDNFHEDPHADLVMSKKLPKFYDNLENNRSKKTKRKGADYYKAKYRKNFIQLLEEEKIYRPEAPNYFSAQASPSNLPPRHFCAVCGDFSNYTCTACGTRYCSIRCLGTHQDTRCLKWTA